MNRRAIAAGPALALTVLLGCSFEPGSLPPRYAHVVVVIEENHSAAQVAGSPWLTAMAAGGATLAGMHGITHPSQPNYIVLFSGSTRGVVDDATYDLSAPNLAASLAETGFSFATYSEDLPAPGSRVTSAGRYVRRHNPCASFTNAPDSVNLPWTSFPADYTQLPTVSFVVPNLDHDMHDGTVEQGDAWLQASLDGYARWAAANDSLLVVTFDECADSDPPQSTPILTILAGSRVRPAVYPQPLTLYSLLRMIDDMYGLAALGLEGTAPEIRGLWN